MTYGYLQQTLIVFVQNNMQKQNKSANTAIRCTYTCNIWENRLLKRQNTIPTVLWN